MKSCVLYLDFLQESQHLGPANQKTLEAQYPEYSHLVNQTHKNFELDHILEDKNLNVVPKIRY